MPDYAKVGLTGRIPKDKNATQRTVNNSTVVNFSMGVYTTKKVNEKYSADYYSIEYWGKPAEAVLPKLIGGTRVQVYGSMHMEEYTAKTGETKTYPKVRASEVIILDDTASAPKPKPQVVEEDAPPF